MKLVIFDCDGTLVDSQHIIAAAMQQAFETEGLAWPGRDPTLKIVGLSLAEAMEALVPDLTSDVRATVAGRYREAFFRLRQDPAHHEPVFEGALDAIESLRRRGVALGIATGKSRRGVHALLERIGLTRSFATIQTADDAPSKPHPAMALQAMAEAGAEPFESILVGDSVFDIEMARSAGIASIGVAWGYHPPAALKEAGADRIASRFRDLEPLLDSIWQGQA